MTSRDGDWYDALPLGDGRVALALGDVAGHGVAAAAMMAQLRSVLRAYALEQPVPAAVADRVDRLLQHVEPHALATFIYAVYDPATATLRYANAGHVPPLLLCGAEASYLEGARSTPLGAAPEGERTEAVVGSSRARRSCSTATGWWREGGG